MFVVSARNALTGKPMATIEATGNETLGELERLFLLPERNCEERSSGLRVIAYDFRRSYPKFVVNARNALTGELFASVEASCDQTVGTLQRRICEEAGRDPDDVVVVYGSNRLSNTSTLAHAGISGEVDVMLVADPRPIRDLRDLARRLEHQREARVSFEVKPWDGMDGDFVVVSYEVDRGSVGPLSAYMRARAIQIELRRSGGNERCIARVSSTQQDVCREVQWHLNGRAVHLEITDAVLY